MPRGRRKRTSSNPSNQNDDGSQGKRPFLSRKVRFLVAAAGFVGLIEIGGIRNVGLEHHRLRSSLDLHLETQLSAQLDIVQNELFGKGTPNNAETLEQMGLLLELNAESNSKLVDDNDQEILVRGGIIETTVPHVVQANTNISQPIIPVQRIPASLQYLADLSVPYNTLKDTPLFWHIPKAGGTSIKHMFSECYFGLVEACESGVTEGHAEDTELQTITMENGWKFINVDLSNKEGIFKAQRWDLVPSKQAHIIVTPLLHDATSMLFSHSHKARLFLVIRHPLERVVSLFYYLQNATHEPTYNPLYQTMTLEEYSNSTFVESNFITRVRLHELNPWKQNVAHVLIPLHTLQQQALINKMTGRLFPDDFEIAKAIMKNSLVGLLENIEESTRRFDQFFGWQGDSTCRDRFLQGGTNRGVNRQHRPLPDPTTFAFQELARKNYMDMWLYRDAKQLFQEQGALFPQRPAKISG